MTNPTAERSCRLLEDALLACVREKPFSDVTVSEICGRAGLTRPTFYNHFDSKEALVARVVDSVFDEFDHLVDAGPVTDSRLLTRAYFAFWERRWDWLVLLVNNNLLHYAAWRLESSLDRIFGEAQFTDKRYVTELSYHNAFLASGMTGILDRWVKDDTRVGHDELAVYVEHMIETLGAGMGMVKV